MTTRIDPRGARFAAGLTTLVLAVVLLTAPGPAAAGLLAFQTAVFALGAGLGVQRTPYAVLFRSLVRPRLGPPIELEDAAPPRFAQAVGLGFALVGLVALLSSATTIGLVAVGFALAAAFLNAATGFCLGCEAYLLLKRATTRPSAPEPVETGRTVVEPQAVVEPGRTVAETGRTVVEPVETTNRV